MSRLINNIRTSKISFLENSYGLNMNNNDIKNINNINIDGATISSSSKIKIGNNAGEFNQGDSTIAIGEKAGQTGQANNTIILNASGTGLNGSDNTGAFYVKPIRNATGTNQLFYDNKNGEITYSTPSLSSSSQSGREFVSQTGGTSLTTSIVFPTAFATGPNLNISLEGIQNINLVNYYYSQNVTSSGFDTFVNAGGSTGIQYNINWIASES